MSSEPWTVRRTPEYLEQISVLSDTELEEVGSKVSELSQRPHPSRPEQTEERLIFHFPGVEPAREVFTVSADIGCELRYEIRALTRELVLLSCRHLDLSNDSLAASRD